MSRTKLTWNEVCKLMKQHNKQNKITSKGEDKSPLDLYLNITAEE